MNKKYGGLVSNPRNTKDTQVVKSITYTTNGTIVETVNLNAWSAATESDTPSPTPISPVVSNLRVFGTYLQYENAGSWVDVSFNGKRILASYNEDMESIDIPFEPDPISSDFSQWSPILSSENAGPLNVAMTKQDMSSGFYVYVGEQRIATLAEGDGSPMAIF